MKCEFIREQLAKNQSFSCLNYNYEIVKFIFTSNMEQYNNSAHPCLSSPNNIKNLKKAILNSQSNDKKKLIECYEIFFNSKCQ
jgi:hypothetical protein